MQTQSLRFTLFLASIGALTSISIDMSLPSVPAIEHEFGIAMGRGGLVMSFFLAGYAFTPLAGGPLTDRFGRRPVLLAALMLYAGSALACAFAGNFQMLLGFRLLQGGAAGVATLLPLTIVRDLLQGDAARQRMSEVTALNNIMPIVAPIAGSLLMTAASVWMALGSWRVVLGTQAAFAIVVAMALLAGFHESLPAAYRQQLHPLQVMRNYVHLLTNREFLGYSVVYGLTFACMFAFVSTSPLILMQRMSVARPTYTVLFVSIAMGNILGSLTSARRSKYRRPFHGTVTFGLCLMVVASAGAVALQWMHFHQPVAIVIPAFLVLFGFGLIGPGITLEALESLPRLAGSGSGVQRAILMACGAGTSGFLAAYCAHNLTHAELATTLTMAGTSAAAFLLYRGCLRRGRAGNIRPAG